MAQQIYSGMSSDAFAPRQSEQLRAQMDAYRSLARNDAVSQLALDQCVRPPPDQHYESRFAVDGITPSNGQRTENNHSSFLQQMLTPAGLMKLCSERQQRKTQIPKPLGIDPVAFYQEREVAVENRICLRMKELEDFIPAALDEQQRQKALTELYSLRLINMQRQLRSEVLHAIRPNANLQTAQYLHLYTRPKKITLADARLAERIEQQRKVDLEAARRLKHLQFLDAVLKRHAEMKDTQARQRSARQRLNKNVITWHANEEVRQKREAERQERERMRRLMEEDEDGYRRLIDEKKHKRLAYLLKQTDEYVDSLALMVHQHKSQLRRHKDMCDGSDALFAAAGGGGSADDSLGSTTAAEELNTSTSSEASTTADNAVVQQNGPASTPDAGNELATVKMLAVTSSAATKPAAGGVPDDEYVPLQPGANANYYQLAHTQKEEVKAQPAMICGGQLKEYQIAGLEWLVSLYNNNLNGILADEMGLGKTIQTIALISYLIEKKNVRGPYLIIVPLSTLSNWMLEFDRWSPSVDKIAYKGTPQVRKSLQYKIRQHKFQVLLTTYEYVIKDKGVLSKTHWKYMIIDEGHRMKNHHCKLTVTLNSHYKAPQRLLLTGTPLQNKLPELWALLNFILPSIFRSCDNFEQWFNAPFQTTGEKVDLNEEESMLIIRRLHKVLRPFLLRRLKKEVESQLPDKTEYHIKCDMSALQRALYTAMQRRGVLIHEAQHKDGKGGARKATALQNTLMQLRKICNHPFMFEGIEKSYAKFRGYKDDAVGNEDIYRAAGKFELLERILPKMFATGHKVLIFCQMTSLMTIMEDYLQWKQYKYMRLDGTTKADDRGGMLKKFSDPAENYFIFMLSTRAGGLGLNLQTADTVIIFDSDWNPHQDLQAQDRAHRIGQKNEVRVLRLITAHSIEEKILAAAQYKLGMDKKIIQAGMFNQRSTHSDRENFLLDILKERGGGSKRKGSSKPKNSIQRNKSQNNISIAEDRDNLLGDGDNSCSQKDESNGAAETAEEEMSVEDGGASAELADDDEDEEDDEFPDEEQLNEMLARSEEEMALFTRMDMERKKHEALQPGGPVPPLIEEKELPEFLSRIAEDLENAAQTAAALKIGEDLADGGSVGGRRARKSMINYADELSEADFLRACEEGNYDDLGMFTQKNRRNGGGGGGGGGGEGDADSDDDSTASPRKRKRGRPSRASQAAAFGGSTGAGLPADVLEQANIIVQKLLNFEDEEGRNLSHPFKRLPTRADLPDYYEVIDKPMDFRRIQLRLKHNSYSSLDEFCGDIELMFRNAQTYNREDSQIYLDAVVLSGYFPISREQAAKECAELREQRRIAADEAAAKAEKEGPTAKPATEDERSGSSRPSSAEGDDDDDDDDDDDEAAEEEGEEAGVRSSKKKKTTETSRAAKKLKKNVESNDGDDATGKKTAGEKRRAVGGGFFGGSQPPPALASTERRKDAGGDDESSSNSDEEFRITPRRSRGGGARRGVGSALDGEDGSEGLTMTTPRGRGRGGGRPRGSGAPRGRPRGARSGRGGRGAVAAGNSTTAKSGSADASDIARKRRISIANVFTSSDEEDEEQNRRDAKETAEQTKTGDDADDDQRTRAAADERTGFRTILSDNALPSSEDADEEMKDVPTEDGNADTENSRNDSSMFSPTGLAHRSGPTSTGGERSSSQAQLQICSPQQTSQVFSPMYIARPTTSSFLQSPLPTAAPISTETRQNDLRATPTEPQENQRITSPEENVDDE